MQKVKSTNVRNYKAKKFQNIFNIKSIKINLPNSII